jgi:hypothetical protein
MRCAEMTSLRATETTTRYTILQTNQQSVGRFVERGANLVIAAF